MNRPPERPIGDRPGAMLATRISILAAEAADPDRYRRGRAYSKQRAVVAIEVEPGEVRGRVQGSDPRPYSVTLKVRPGRTPMPVRADIAAFCSCPDDSLMCKHAVAVLLEFADDVARTPDLLTRWRVVDPEAPEPVTAVPERSPERASGRGAPPPRRRPEPESPVDTGPSPELLAFFGVDRPPSTDDGLPEIWDPLVPARPRSGDEVSSVAGLALDSALSELGAIYG